MLGKRFRREERSHLVVLGLEAGRTLTGEQERTGRIGEKEL